MERCAEVADGLVWMHRGLVGMEGGLSHRREYANVLLAAKAPCMSSALQVLQIATNSV